MFTLNQLTPKERRDLAAKVDADPVYLWQCGAGLRSPSLKLAQKLMKADKRLTVAGLLAPQIEREANAKIKVKIKKSPVPRNS
ncbi:MAG: hypothetical protein WC696_12290 [Candidatus Methylopumilus sp.]|jgi:hypothetical protein